MENKSNANRPLKFYFRLKKKDMFFYNIDGNESGKFWRKKVSSNPKKDISFITEILKERREMPQCKDNHDFYNQDRHGGSESILV